MFSEKIRKIAKDLGISKRAFLMPLKEWYKDEGYFESLEDLEVESKRTNRTVYLKPDPMSGDRLPSMIWAGPSKDKETGWSFDTDDLFVEVEGEEPDPVDKIVDEIMSGKNDIFSLKDFKFKPDYTEEDVIEELVFHYKPKINGEQAKQIVEKIKEKK